ncbi:hypothetical protein CTI12_AA313820 [Artemisia annua]|uniref:Uncharacterized protein n=1 Tax=Artemisia annua TaxID=35608 RepID=A0A2U1N317_ARTAN|nr:hypothetical protein CTI12_AA313820 [Artemisia annua]
MNNNRRRAPSSSSKKCKKHPKHEQSPGVCSLCLRDRLAKISKSSSRVIAYDSSCSSSSVSSVSSVSSCSSYVASPMHDYRKGKLKKSKSMAFVSERIVENDAKKKGGFWSKLMHSRTVREILTTRV